MNSSEEYIKRCIELAEKGMGHVAPNPMVGCVIVHQGNIIGEGYHQQHGQAHAEVNAINSVKDKELLKESALYVNLEPCSHHGKTPPCADLILMHKIPKVVIGCEDPNPLVSGEGIQKLREFDCNVEVNVLEKECRELNKRFITFYEKKRPYVILKWAQTKDKFIDSIRNGNEVGKQLKITSEETNKLVHQWRTEEQAILIGSTTAILDNSQLTARLHEGKNPLRILIDTELKTPASNKIFDSAAPTLVFSYERKEGNGNTEYILLEKEKSVLQQVFAALRKQNITSLIVEGGKKTIDHFIEENFWDEARVITNNSEIGSGVKAPELKGNYSETMKMGNDTINTYYNNL